MSTISSCSNISCFNNGLAHLGVTPLNEATGVTFLLHETFHHKACAVAYCKTGVRHVRNRKLWSMETIIITSRGDGQDEPRAHDHNYITGMRINYRELQFSMACHSHFARFTTERQVRYCSVNTTYSTIT